MLTDHSAHPEDESCENDQNTDGREKHEWQTKYATRAWVQIVIESTFLFILTAIVLVAIFLNWNGDLALYFPFKIPSIAVFTVYAYYALAGALGGLTFSLKYQYRVIGRGYWHCDRVCWRFFTPLVSLIVGLVVGAMAENSLIKSPSHSVGPGCLVLGFLAGYFADMAIGKMYEVAKAIFGSKTKRN